MTDPVELLPMDEHNRRLAANVYPPDWTNPQPASMYNLVVIGAGTAGLVTAAGAAGLGAKVALIERRLLGGDCLNFGCVPSKCLLRSARAAADLRHSEPLGVRVIGKVEVDFPAVAERMRRLRARISANDSAKRFRDLGIDVFLGEAGFAGPDTITVAGQTLRFKKAVIATGTRPVEPPIDGLQEAGFLTNETIFSLTELPTRLTVVGGGPIGCELAQAFRRFGSKVTLIHSRGQLLPKDDAEAGKLLAEVFEREGIELILNARAKKLECLDGEKVIHIETNGEERAVRADEILIAVGRRPNLEGLNLETAGVRYDKKGVTVNDCLQTANPRVYAAGDISMAYKFTHAADAAARIVIQNALFPSRKKLSSLVMPWCTYCDPEIAHVGLTEREITEKAIPVDTYTRPLDEVDRAIADGEEEGFVKIHVKKGTDTIVGATIVARHAGEMIGEITVAMTAKLGLGKLASVIHPYPTQSEAIKHIADAQARTRLTPRLKNIFTCWLKWRRR